MKLLLLRHGATAGNLKKQYIGSTDQPLSECGIQQAKERSKTLPDVEQIWVSSMIRAKQTADLFYPTVRKKQMDSLREMDFGRCEEKTWEETNDPTIYDGWLKEDMNAAFPDGERYGELLARTNHALCEIAKEIAERNIENGAIIAHGGVLMALMSQHAVPHKSFFLWQCSNCGGFQVEFDTNTLEMTDIKQIGEDRIW